jgi:hypothetical protein
MSCIYIRHGYRLYVLFSCPVITAHAFTNGTVSERIIWKAQFVGADWNMRKYCFIQKGSKQTRVEKYTSIWYAALPNECAVLLNYDDVQIYG